MSGEPAMNILAASSTPPLVPRIVEAPNGEEGIDLGNLENGHHTGPTVGRETGGGSRGSSEGRNHVSSTYRSYPTKEIILLGPTAALRITLVILIQLQLPGRYVIGLGSLSLKCSV